MEPKRISLLALGVLTLAVMVYNIPVNPLAYAFQVVTYSTRATINQLVPSTVHGKSVFVSVEDKTWIRVVDANSSTTISLFNMTNALMNGFNINYQPTNISCNPTLSECVVGYTTGGTGTCAFSPNLCAERIVLVDIANSAWSALKNGRNYTQTSNTLANVAFSYGTPQFTVIATLMPTGGGNSFFQFEAYNDSDPVNAHPFVVCCTLSSGAASTFNGANALGTFTIGGLCCNNYIGLAQTSGASFQSINIGARSLGCTVATGSQVNDIKYTSDSLGQFWWTIQGTSIKKISQSGLGACSVITTTDLTAVTGGNNLKSIAIDSTLGYVFVESNSKFFVINETSLSATPIAIYGVPSDTTLLNGIAPYPNSNNGAVAVSSSSAKVTVFYWNVQGSSGGGGGITGGGNPCNTTGNPATNCSDNGRGQIDCSLPQNANIVTCWVQNNNQPGSAGNPLNINNNTNVVNNFGCVVAQSVGIINNCNLKTNGVGYLLLAIALLLVNVLWLLAVHSFNQRGVVTPQPIFVHALISFAVIAAFALIGWTDPTILIVAIVALVAFTAPKFIGMIRGGGIPAE